MPPSVAVSTGNYVNVIIFIGNKAHYKIAEGHDTRSRISIIMLNNLIIALSN